MFLDDAGETFDTGVHIINRHVVYLEAAVGWFSEQNTAPVVTMI